MFERKIKERSSETLKKDHEFWFKRVREKKLIPEGNKKSGGADPNLEVEKSTDVNLERITDDNKSWV